MEAVGTGASLAKFPFLQLQPFLSDDIIFNLLILGSICVCLC